MTGSAPTTRCVFHPVLAGDVFADPGAHGARARGDHGDVGSGAALLWDVTDRERATDCCTPPTPAGPAQPALEALTAAEPYDLVLLEETFGDRPDLGDDHLHLAASPRCSPGCGPPAASRRPPQVVAIHLGHHNPPPADARPPVGRGSAPRAGRDGEVLVPAGSTRPPGRPAPAPHAACSAAPGRASRCTPKRLVAADPLVTYVATSGDRPDDESGRGRVALHRARRPAALDDARDH